MQRYKVFINEHLILFSESHNLKDFESSVLLLSNPSVQEIQFCVDFLFREEAPLLIAIESKSINHIWESFCKSYKWIEAAGGIVKNEAGDYLIIKRLAKWDLPKGKIEKGELPEEAAIREIQEECGLGKLSIKQELAATFHMYVLNDSIVLKKTHWFELNSHDQVELIPQVEEDIETVLWLNEETFLNKMNKSYASLRDLIQTYLAR